MKRHFLLIISMLYGINLSYAVAETLPANPWGKVTTESSTENTVTAEPNVATVDNSSDSAALSANPWAKPNNNSNVVRYTPQNNAETQNAQTAEYNPTIQINVPQNSDGGIRHVAPTKITSRAELNQPQDTSFTDDIAAMFDSNKNQPSEPVVTTPSMPKMDFNIDKMLPDFDKIKRDTTRKFNNATAPIRKSVKEAKDFFEKGSGVKLNEVFK